MSTPKESDIDSSQGSSRDIALEDISQKIDSLQRAVANLQGESHEIKISLKSFLKECALLKRERIWWIFCLYIEFPDIVNPISFCIDVILKEAKEEGRLVKQIFYIMLSAYTNNPINLAINSPSGEGKTYVLQKVGELFPKQDVMFLAGMTEKALFHRSGILVVKDEAGEYQSIENKLEDLDSRIVEKESERVGTKDKTIFSFLHITIFLLLLMGEEPRVLHFVIIQISAKG